MTEPEQKVEPNSRRGFLKIGVAAVVGLGIGIAATALVQDQKISSQNSTISSLNSSVASLDSSLSSVDSSISTIQSQVANQALYVNTATKQVVIQAVMNTAGNTYTTATIHNITWDLGSAASASMFTTTVSPEEFYNALMSIGAVPGNTLQLTSPAGQLETGTPLSVSVNWEGLTTPYKMEQLINNFTGGTPFVFGGNLSTNETAGTGCIICTFSCPVAIVSSGGIGWKSSSGNTLSSLVPQGQKVTITFEPQS